MDSFCGSCGSYLEWTGQRVEPEAPVAPPEPATEAASPADRSGLVDRARRVLGMDEAATSVAAGTAGSAAAGQGGTAAESATDAPAPVVEPAPAATVVSRRRVVRAVAPKTMGPAPALPSEAPPDAPAEPPGEVEAPAAVDTPLDAPAEVEAAADLPSGMVEVDDASSSRPGSGLEFVPVVAPAPVPAPMSVSVPAPAPAPVRPTQPPPIVPRMPPPTSRPRASAAPPAPAAPVTPPAVQPSAVTPAAERPRSAPRPVAIEETLAPGERRCANCGAGNDPQRQFCRRCGESLAVPIAPLRVPWWRRLFGGRSRAPVSAGERTERTRAAGPARARGGVGRALRNVLALLAVAAIAAIVTGYAAVPAVRSAVDGAITSVRIAIAPTYVPVNTAGRATGLGLPSHPPEAAFDGFSNTYWAAPARASAPSLTAHFSPPADIAKILITSGASDAFQAEPRPHQVLIELLDGAGSVLASTTAQLTDTHDPQTVGLDAHGVAAVRFTIQSSYPSISGSSVSITEVEFRAAR